MSILASNAALLVIDMQIGFDDPSWGRRNHPHMEDRVAELLDDWRSRGAPVIHAKHMSTDPKSPLRPGQPGNRFKLCAEPRAQEPVIEKRVNSCFIGTSLEADLRKRDYNAVVIAG